MTEDPHHDAAALRQSAALHRALFQAVDEGVSVFERMPRRPDGLRDYRYVAMNPAMQHMFGIVDLSGQSIRDHFPDDIEDWYDDYDRVLETGEAVRFERESKPHGMVLEMFVTRIDAGEGPQLLAVMRDVTARRRAEERRAFILEVADLVRALSSSELIQGAVGDLLGRHLGATRAHYADIVEDAQIAVVSREYTDGVPDAVGHHALEGFPACATAARTGRTLVIDDCLTDDRLSEDERAAFGALHTRAIVLVPLVRHGLLDALLAVHQDEPRQWTRDEVALIDEVAVRTWAALTQARGETELRESEARLQQALDAAQMGTLTYDVDRGLEHLDGRAREILGVDTETLGTQESIALLHAEDLEQLAAELDEWIDSGDSDSFQTTLRVARADGNACWVDVHAIVSFDETTGRRRPRRAVGVIVDVSARKEAEESLRRLNDTLEDRVVERTRQARMLARQLTLAEQHERDRLSRVLHDDLQQQLYGVQMKLRQVIAGIRSGDTSSAIPDATEADRWVEQSIELTRRLSVDLSPPILGHEGLADALKWLGLQMAETHDLHVDVQSEALVDLANMQVRLLVFQIVRELLFNVVKHAGTGRADIALRHDGGDMVIVVADEGDGFDPEAAPAGSARLRTGLGLSGATERLDLIGGSMTIDTAPAAGTRVTIRVPTDLDSDA